MQNQFSVWFLLSLITCWVGWEVKGYREGTIWVYGIREKIVVGYSLRKCEKKSLFFQDCVPTTNQTLHSFHGDEFDERVGYFYW